MLFGGYQHTIDKKGRIAIPAKLRAGLGESFMLCCGISGKRCLCAYSNGEWDKLVAKIDTLPNTKASTVKRFLYEGAFSVEFDSQGRILVPNSLREYAKLEGDAHIIGMSTNLEIWNTALWEEEKQQYTPEAMAAVMEELNF